LLCHAGADIDSVSSAAAFFFSLKKNPRSVIGVPDHISLGAKAFCEKTGVKFVLNPQDIDSFDVLVLFDLSSFEMLGSYAQKVGKFGGGIFLFDHHEILDDSLLKKSVSMVDKKAVSCTEVVYSYLKSCKAKISPQVARLLACGIIVDSGRFFGASENTFSSMHELLKASKESYEGLFSLFEEKTDLSETVAVLKSARRARIFNSFERIIAASTVNAFESSSAMSLVALGADVAFAGGEKNGKVFISGRARNSFVAQTGFDLVKDVFFFLPQHFSGKGGGHPAAAGFNGENFDVSLALEECVRLVHVFLEKKNSKKSGLKEYD